MVSVVLILILFWDFNHDSEFQNQILRKARMLLKQTEKIYPYSSKTSAIMLFAWAALGLLAPLASGFIPTAARSMRQPLNVRTLKLGIDVSSLPVVPEYQNIVAATATSKVSNLINLPQGDIYSDIQNALIFLGGILYVIYEKRPRGSARDDLLDIKKSTIPGANLGVFAKSFIAAGTSLGIFPGYIRNTEDALE